MTAVSYYYCDIDEGKHAEHSYMNAPYCPWCKVAELEKIRDAAQVVVVRMPIAANMKISPVYALAKALEGTE